MYEEEGQGLPECNRPQFLSRQQEAGPAPTASVWSSVAPGSSCLAQEHPEVVREKLLKEVHLGRTAGPFDSPRFASYLT